MEKAKSKITIGAILKRGLRDTLILGGDRKQNFVTSTLALIASVLVAIFCKKDGGIMEELLSLYQIIGILVSAVIISFIVNITLARGRIRRELTTFQKSVFGFIKRGEDIGRDKELIKGDHGFVREANRWREDLKIFLKENQSVAPFSFGDLLALGERSPVINPSEGAALKRMADNGPPGYRDHVILVKKLKYMYREHFSDE